MSDRRIDLKFTEANLFAPLLFFLGQVFSAFAALSVIFARLNFLFM